MSGTTGPNGAKRRHGPVYFTGLSVAGARCFGPAQRLELVAGGRPAKWTVILGENGVGKTTLLQCAWLMAPLVSEPRPGALAGSNPRGVASSRSEALQRSASADAVITADVALDRPFTSTVQGTPARATLQVGAATSIFGSYPDRTHVVCCGYGALRRSAEATVEMDAASDSAASLFSDDATLISGSEWLLRADYAASSTSDRRAAHRRDKIRTALIDLLPDVTELRVAGLDEEPPRPRIDAKTHYGWRSSGCSIASKSWCSSITRPTRSGRSSWRPTRDRGGDPDPQAGRGAGRPARTRRGVDRGAVRQGRGRRAAELRSRSVRGGRGEGGAERRPARQVLLLRIQAEPCAVRRCRALPAEEARTAESRLPGLAWVLLARVRLEEPLSVL